VSRMAKSKAGVVLDECMFLARGTLPKTPSGKIQRFRCRQLVASELLEPVARVALRPRRAGIVEQSERAAAAVRAQG
jgi:acyl-coenzyme A synthetase/AMP-(fatty) acid ligase